MNDSGPRFRGRIAYVSQFYPHLTETFVYREVLALRRLGWEVATFATWSPDRATLSRESQSLVEETGYVFPLRWVRFVASHLRYLLRRPGRYLGTLLFVLTRRGETLRNRGFAFLHFGMAGYLARAMEQEGIRHVHAHFSINAATIALVVSRLLGITFSFTAHNLLFTRQILLRDKVREARFVAAISQDTRRWLLDHVHPLDAGEKVHVVHCGLVPSQFAPPTAPPTNPVPRVLFVAQLAERKGAPVLVEACRILVERGVELRCTIVGDGPERPRLEEAVARHGLGEVVLLRGALPQEEVAPLLDTADIFVLPCVIARDGDRDGVPVSLMEAMAKELPVVSTTVSGIPELVEHGVSGLLVPPHDAPSLAGALRRLLEDAALRRRLGAAARRRVESEFDVGESARRLGALFARYVAD